VSTTLAQPAPSLAPRPETVAGEPWYRTTWFLAFASGLALWLAQGPFHAPALAWVAPLGWLLLIRAEKLPGKRPYGVLYLAGLAHWLLVLEGVRRAYWALYFGWLALAAYLAVYTLLFVGLSRVGVHRLKLPLCLVAPAVWVGLELVRAHAVTGFAVALLGHTQAEFPALIQIADLGGAYAVSFVVMFVAACIVQTYPWWFGRWQRGPVFALVALVAVVIGYGQFRLDQLRQLQSATERRLPVVLVQNSVDTVFGVPLERLAETFRGYQAQAEAAAAEHPDARVMVWPESVFMSVYPDVQADADALPPAESQWPEEEFQRFLAAKREEFQFHARQSAERVARRHATGGMPQIVGTNTYHFRRDRVDQYNTALLLSPDGEVAERYYKMHLVMFGEYIPGGDWFPWIYAFTPMGGGLARGDGPTVFDVDGYRLSPSICFESTVPHLIRGQIRQLTAQGREPDALVNVTNDGWFWGSGLLDLHYRCAIFRAVEHRKPMLVAANTGFSTAIDAAGQVVTRGPRREVATLAVHVPLIDARSPYTTVGDLFALACIALTAACALVGLRRPPRRTSTKLPTDQHQPA
jgi:apolipoprotein N-acyltransferase